MASSVPATSPAAAAGSLALHAHGSLEHTQDQHGLDWVATPSPLPVEAEASDAHAASLPPSAPTSSAASPPHGQKRKAGDMHDILSRTAPHLLDELGRRSPDHEEDHRPGTSRKRPGRSSRRSGTPKPPPPAAADMKDLPPHLRTPVDFRGPNPELGDATALHPAPQWAPGTALGPEGPLVQTTTCPMCRNGWQYEAAGPAADLLPLTVYRTLPMAPRGVHWSWQGRSVYTSISEHADVVSTDRGFRSARANVPVRQGAWYVEVEILPPGPPVVEHSGPNSPMPHTSPHPRPAGEKLAPGPEWSKMKDGPHVRLGWGRRESTLNAPVGFDAYSYGFRDLGGERVTIARPVPYGQPFGPGDVVGMYIRLPDERQPSAGDPYDPARIQRKRVPIRYRGGLYFETLEYAQSKEMDFLLSESKSGRMRLDALGNLLPVHPPEGDGTKRKSRTQPGQVDKVAMAREKLISGLRPLPRLEGSSVGFFVNGQPQGTAFRNLLDYRPLRRADAPSSTGKGKGKGKGKGQAAGGNAPRKGANRGLAAGDEEDGGQPELSHSASQAAFLKARENYFDDGATGYFAFVSCFGGAQVRINPGPHFRYPPPDDIDAALAAVDGQGGTDPSSPLAPPSAAAHAQALARDVAAGSLAAKVNSVVNNLAIEAATQPATATGQQGRGWRPLSERADEWMEEQLRLDLLDEAKAQERAAKLAPATGAGAGGVPAGWSFAEASRLGQARLAASRGGGSAEAAAGTGGESPAGASPGAGGAQTA